MLPFLNNINVDSVVKEQTLIKWLEDFKADENKDKISFKQDNKIILININYLVSGKKKVGYQLLITDDTEEQKYLEMLQHFNSKLEQEVDQKTKNIVEMHDRLIISMATMVESRDNSTGGHIRRTSDCMRILIAAMKAGGYPDMTDKFCHDIIKAAPMHDLGKIAVDDAILRFEGRYNDEQYKEMKKHAAEGARIVHEILKDTDDYEFHILAENVAHYHHERWDGSGYPDGLSGTDIPLEARIMALADVFDALVSPRCYKEPMSFDKAFEIIAKGLGRHFDPVLGAIFLQCRPELEKLYRSMRGPSESGCDPNNASG
jgi:putative two-component system response regulator